MQRAGLEQWPEPGQHQLPEPLLPCQGWLHRQVLGIHLPCSLQPSPAGSALSTSEIWMLVEAMTSSNHLFLLSYPPFSHLVPLDCPKHCSKASLQHLSRFSIYPLPLIHPTTPRTGLVFSFNSIHRFSLISLQFSPTQPSLLWLPHPMGQPPQPICHSPVPRTALLGWSSNLPDCQNLPRPQDKV